MKTLTEIAAEFCADRVAERDALRAMLPCTLDRDENIDVEFPAGQERCGRGFWMAGTHDDYYPVDLPQSRWCPNCLANLERAAVVNRARRRRGGMVRAMVAAYSRSVRAAEVR